MDKMTIAQGLKEMKLIDQKVAKRQGVLRGHCARPSDKKDLYEGKQTEKITALRQSIVDLIWRKGRIRSAVQKANLATDVTWKTKTYKLADIVYLKKEAAGALQRTLQMLDHNMVERDVEMRKKGDTNSTLEVILHYDPVEKERALEAHMDLMSNLDVLIDQANHNTFIEVAQYPGDEWDSEVKK